MGTHVKIKLNKKEGEANLLERSQFYCAATRIHETSRGLHRNLTLQNHTFLYIICHRITLTRTQLPWEVKASAKSQIGHLPLPPMSATDPKKGILRRSNRPTNPRPGTNAIVRRETRGAHRSDEQSQKP